MRKTEDIFDDGYVQAVYESIIMILEGQREVVKDKCIEEIIKWHQFIKNERKKPTRRTKYVD